MRVRSCHSCLAYRSSTSQYALQRTNHPRQGSSPYATVAAPAPQIESVFPAIQHYPASQPPSHKPADFRKSQLHRQYTSLLRSSPLILFFQHNNLRAEEWSNIRRELAFALRRTSKKQMESDVGSQPMTQDPAEGVRLQIIHTGVFGAALRVVTFYDPVETVGAIDGSQPIHPLEQRGARPTHSLSEEAYKATVLPDKRQAKGPYGRVKKRDTSLHTLLSGPIAVLSFPGVTPEHLATALSILSPTPGSKSAFPAPRKKEAPGLYEAKTQTGLQKLLLLGARVEGKTMDGLGVRWVGGLKGGIDGLRGQLVGVLQGVGMSLTGGLEGIGSGLWGVMESRRRVLEEEESGQTSKETGS